MQQRKTKIIWSIHHRELLNEKKLKDHASILLKNDIDLIHIYYTKNIKDQCLKLKKQLESHPQRKKTTKNSSHCAPFLTSFIGKQAKFFLYLKENILKEGQVITTHIHEDTQRCIDEIEDYTCDYDSEIIVTDITQVSDISLGTSFSLGNGFIELEVIEILSATKKHITVKVKVKKGGEVSRAIKVSSQDISTTLFPLLEIDKQNALSQFDGMSDFILIDKISSSNELKSLKSILTNKNHISTKKHPTTSIESIKKHIVSPKLILVLDSHEILKNLEDFIKEVDGVLIDRTALNLCCNINEVPNIQKEIIKKCHDLCKFIIITSDFFKSMSHSATPTRAEITDIAYTVLDGNDAILINPDVTTSKYMKEAAYYLCDAILKSEELISKDFKIPLDSKLSSHESALAQGALEMAVLSNAKAVVCFTEGGYSVAKLSSFKSHIDIIALTYSEEIKKQLKILSSVSCVTLDKELKVEELISFSKDYLESELKFKKGSKFVFISLTASIISKTNSNFFTLQEI
jgi:pyruvate kinase